MNYRRRNTDDRDMGVFTGAVSSRRVRLTKLLFLVWCVAVLAAAAKPSATQTQAPATLFLGFSLRVPPSDSLAFRRAIGYAIDREAVASAVAPHSHRKPSPAYSIQHPDLPGYDAALRAFPFDSARAKELYKESGWQSGITILVGPGPAADPYRVALYDTVAESIRKTLEAPVTVQRVANFNTLVRAARSGIAPMWMYGWRSDPRDYAYPSFPLALADEYFLTDPEIKALVDKGDARAVERILLDKALIIPIIHY